MPLDTIADIRPAPSPRQTAFLNYAADVVRSTAGAGDPRIIAEGLGQLWPALRPAGSQGGALADAALGAAREATKEALRAPPYALLQAYAAMWQVVHRPSDRAAAESAIRDPAATIGRLLQPADQVKLRALYRSPAEHRRRAGIFAGVTGTVGIALGVVLGRLSTRGKAP